MLPEMRKKNCHLKGSQTSMSKNYDKSGFINVFKRFPTFLVEMCRLIDASFKNPK